MPEYTVTFQPADVTVTVPPGTSLMDAMDRAGINGDFPCGGRGTCGKCRVKVLSAAGRPSAAEQEHLDAGDLAAGIRLACSTTVDRDLVVEFGNSPARHNILTSAGASSTLPEPHLEKIFVPVAEPSLVDPRGDWQRLKAGLAAAGRFPAAPEIPLTLLRRLPDALRRAGHSLTAVLYNGRITGLEEGDTSGTMLGMAFDIGTTTIVGYLLDLYTGRRLAVASALNPQARFGADVISRITFANRETGGLEKLQAAVLGAMNEVIGTAVQAAGSDRNHIYAITVAANTCMHHLLLGITPRYIAVSPYVGAVSEPLVTGAVELGLNINPAGKVFVLPNIAGFVGADTTAVLLAVDMDRSQGVRLVLDIGTNGEIVLGTGKRTLVCSAAAGPAFEGARISSGMRGAAGAIDHVRLAGELEYSVIGGGRPLGICGSGLLDTVAGLLEAGLINKRGKLLSPDQLTGAAARVYQHRLVEYQGAPAFLLAEAEQTGHGRPVLVTQQDIRELQLAKGAMAAGVQVLMEAAGVEVGDIEEVLLAGAFGNYLNPHSACAIGLLPPALEGRIKMIGNAAGTGSQLALLSSSQYRRAAAMAGSVEFVELGSYPGFNGIFARCTYFNH